MIVNIPVIWLNLVTLKPVWNNRILLLKTKLTIFNSNVKYILLYGSGTWKHTKAVDSRLQVFVNTCLRQILRIRWPDTRPKQHHKTGTRLEPPREAQDRSGWKTVVKALCSGRDEED